MIFFKPSIHNIDVFVQEIINELEPKHRDLLTYALDVRIANSNGKNIVPAITKDFLRTTYNLPYRIGDDSAFEAAMAEAHEILRVKLAERGVTSITDFAGAA